MGTGRNTFPTPKTCGMQFKRLIGNHCFPADRCPHQISAGANRGTSRAFFPGCGSRPCIGTSSGKSSVKKKHFFRLGDPARGRIPYLGASAAHLKRNVFITDIRKTRPLTGVGNIKPESDRLPRCVARIGYPIIKHLRSAGNRFENFCLLRRRPAFIVQRNQRTCRQPGHRKRTRGNKHNHYKRSQRFSVSAQSIKQHPGGEKRAGKIFCAPAFSAGAPRRKTGRNISPARTPAGGSGIFRAAHIFRAAARLFPNRAPAGFRLHLRAPDPFRLFPAGTGFALRHRARRTGLILIF